MNFYRIKVNGHLWFGSASRLPIAIDKAMKHLSLKFDLKFKSSEELNINVVRVKQEDVVNERS